MVSESALLYLDNRRLHLILLPTEKCNFRCTYCYESFDSGVMSSETVAGIKNLLTHRANDLTHLEIGWFGGEPLLARKVIEDIGQHAKTLSIRRGFSYTSSMATNGYLLDESVAQSMAESGINAYQISIDGSEHIHNKTRVDALGRETFTRIMSNLRQLKSTAINFEVALRLHVSANSTNDMPVLAELLSHEFSEDGRFRIYLKHVENLGGPGSTCAASLKADMDLSRLEQLFPSHMLLHKHRSSPSICYAAAGNSLVIRATGEICKCTVSLNDPDNIIGKISKDGKVEVDDIRFRSWVSTLFHPQHAKCPLHAIKALTLRSTGPVQKAAQAG